MRLVIAALSGVLFGSGLYVSGMTDTRKVQGWLDFFGNWDPTLAFVMGGAMAPMFVAWRLTAGRRPRFGDAFPSPPSKLIDGRLLLGSALFGTGWGLSGLCPGPAMASLSYGGLLGALFFASMVLGMLLAAVPRWRGARVPTAADV